MKTSSSIFFLLAFALALTAQTINPNHPRVLSNAAIRTTLLAKKTANDPTWLALKAQADNYAARPVMTWDADHYYVYDDNFIFYTYEGGGWYEAALPLAMAHQMTKGSNTGNFPTVYSAKLLQLADTMIAAQNNYFLNGGDTLKPMRIDSYFPSRFICPAIAMIYDWCYDELTSARRTALYQLMNDYYDDIRANAYQANGRAGDNYFMGHAMGIGMMGYASHGDNPRAAELIAWAKNRFDGTPSALIGTDTARSNITQVFEGGYKTVLSTETYNNPTYLKGAPWKAGIHTEGWGYGSGAISRLLDYMQCIKTTTGEDIFNTANHHAWLTNLLRGYKHELQPDRASIDFFCDWGGSYGGIISMGYPTRLAYYLAGTPEGPGAQHLRYTFIKPSTNPCVVQNVPSGVPFPDAKWEAFYFADASRPSAAMSEPGYYSGFPNPYPQGAQVQNAPVPYFVMRNNFSTTGTWASALMGAAHYEGHEHHIAGHIAIRRASDFLLMEASIFKNQDPGGPDCGGMSGNEAGGTSASGANTLFFDDNCTYYPFCNEGNTPDYTLGGQSSWGRDQVIADQQNNFFTYVRSDLTTAYDWSYDSSYIPLRTLRHFYRTFTYLPEINTFAVFDQATANANANTNGQHVKHLRWHLTKQPTLVGRKASVQNGASKLNLHTLYPTNAQVLVVDENPNPDAAFTGFSYNNSDTWRLEVSTPGAPLAEEFLTVLQAGAIADANMATMHITATSMRGSRIEIPGKTPHIVLFNRKVGATPVPITTTTYNYTNPALTVHLLGGMVPNAKYSIVFNGTTVTVTKASNGAVRASTAGVLRFTTTLSALGAVAAEKVGLDAVFEKEPAMSVQVWPNPAREQVQLTVEGNENRAESVAVFNAMGQLVHQETLAAGENVLAVTVAEWPAGVYFVKVGSGEMARFVVGL